MGIEIERKFLVVGHGWRDGAGKGERLVQGYLTQDKGCAVRIRKTANQATLTIKGQRVGLSRLEFEYEIPLKDADQMLRSLRISPTLQKTRYRVDHCGLMWDIDVFSGDAEGLVIAEIELRDARQKLNLPPWVGGEVTYDPRYRNTHLARAGWSAADSIGGQQPAQSWHMGAESPHMILNRSSRGKSDHRGRTRGVF
jgi:adenylate cyclase